MRWRLFLISAFGLALAGCAHLQPAVEKPKPQVPAISEAEERKAGALMDEAKKLFGQRMYAEAAEKAQEMLAKHPRSNLAPEAVMLTAECRYQQGNLEFAAENAQKLVQQYPASDKVARAKKLMGDIYLAKKDYIKAGQQYLEGLAAAKNQDDRELCSLPLSALIEENLLAGEIRVLYRKYPQSEAAPALGLKLARMEIDAKNQDEARKILNELVKKYPQSPEAEQAQSFLAMISEKKEIKASLEPPRIGLLVPLTGKYGEYGAAVKEGVELAVGEYNLKTSAKVSLFVEDTRGDMVDAVRCAERLIDSLKVMGLIGEVLSGPTIAAAAVANTKKIPLLSPTAMEERIASIGPYIFQLTQSTSWQGASLATYAVKKLGLSSLAVLYPSESSAEATANAFRQQAMKEGAKVTAFLSYEPGTTDFKEHIEKMKAYKIQAVFLPAPPTDIVMIAPQLAYNQLKVQLLGHEAWADPKVLSQGEVYVEGAILAALSPSSGLAQSVQAFEQAYKKRYNKNPSKQASQGYDAAKILLEALKKNPASSEDLCQALLATGSFAQEGAGHIAYGKSGASPRAQFKTIRNKKLIDLE